MDCASSSGPPGPKGKSSACSWPLLEPSVAGLGLATLQESGPHLYPLGPQACPGACLQLRGLVAHPLLLELLPSSACRRHCAWGWEGLWLTAVTLGPRSWLSLREGCVRGDPPHYPCFLILGEVCIGWGPLGLAQLQGLDSDFGISQSGFHTSGAYERGGFHGAVVLKMAGMNGSLMFFLALQNLPDARGCSDSCPWWGTKCVLLGSREMGKLRHRRGQVFLVGLGPATQG